MSYNRENLHLFDYTAIQKCQDLLVKNGRNQMSFRDIMFSHHGWCNHIELGSERQSNYYWQVSHDDWLPPETWVFPVAPKMSNLFLG